MRTAERYRRYADHPLPAAPTIDGQHQKVWGAELYGQVSQRSFLVREPVNPVPERACHRRLTPQIWVLPSRTGTRREILR